MNEIKKESKGERRTMRRYLNILFVGLVIFIFAELLLYVKERVSREIYELILLFFVVMSFFMLYAVSKHKEMIKNKN